MPISKRTLARSLIYASIFLLLIDLIYKYSFNISFQNRQNCVLYKNLPRVGFLFYEYFIELALILIAGVFAAALLETFFVKFGKFYPKNPITAFIYASILPVCSCGALPIVESLGGKMRIRTLTTFVIAAPLLNPFIVVLSYSVLGLKYTLLRIAGSFILSIACGFAVEPFFKNSAAPAKPINCAPDICVLPDKDIYLKSYAILKKVFPYLILAAAVGMALEYFSPAGWLQRLDLNGNIFGLLAVIVVGIPLYFCNGADVFVLKPLIYYSGLPMGTALAFSLTSTSVCLTSLILMVKFYGKKATFALLMSVIVVVFILGWLINLFF